MSRVIIGVMGGGENAPEQAIQDALRLGELIAMQGWVLLNGGRNVGVMEASAKGARNYGGLTVGILPGRSGQDASEYLDIRIVTGMGDARNAINVLSSDAVVACAGGPGAGDIKDGVHQGGCGHGLTSDRAARSWLCAGRWCLPDDSC